MGHYADAGEAGLLLYTYTSYTPYWPHSCATGHPAEKLRRGPTVMQDATSCLIMQRRRRRRGEEKVSWQAMKLVAWEGGEPALSTP